MRRRLAALAALIATAVIPSAALAQAPLQIAGTFQMNGTVTVAHNVLGEYVGEAVQRSWTFTSLCAAAPCATVQLVRQRATGSDTLRLHQTGADSYAGAGVFSAPLRCSGHVYRPGESIPFKITVRVTATDPSGAATAIAARYINQSRINLTPCIGVLGHDAARYTGQLAAG